MAEVPNRRGLQCQCLFVCPARRVWTRLSEASAAGSGALYKVTTPSKRPSPQHKGTFYDSCLSGEQREEFKVSGGLRMESSAPARE